MSLHEHNDRKKMLFSFIHTVSSDEAITAETCHDIKLKHLPVHSGNVSCKYTANKIMAYKEYPRNISSVQYDQVVEVNLARDI